MTRARALKQIIRTRAAKTGERYTTARRIVLRELNKPPASASAREGSGELRRDLAVAASGREGGPIAPIAPVAPVARVTPAPARGGLSDAASLKKTGHDLAHWFAVLDRFGAVEKGHTAAARHLYDAHQVDGWYAQGITVAYERERGVRAVNQRCDGEFEMSASKVMTASVKQVAKALSDPRVREQWIGDADAKLAEALANAFTGPKSKGVVIRPDGLGRFRYKWGDTTVQFYMAPKPGKVSVTVTQTKLQDASAVDSARGRWKTALTALAAHFTA